MNLFKDQFRQFIEFFNDKVYAFNFSVLAILEFISSVDMLLKLLITLGVLVYTVKKLSDRNKQNRHNDFIREEELKRILDEDQYSEVIDKLDNREDSDR